MPICTTNAKRIERQLYFDEMNKSKDSVLDQMETFCLQIKKLGVAFIIICIKEEYLLVFFS